MSPIGDMLAAFVARNRCKRLRLDTDGLPENSPAQGRPLKEITPNMSDGWRPRNEAFGGLEPFPKRLAPWEPRHQATGFRIRGAARQIELRPVSNREAHPFRETL